MFWLILSVLLWGLFHSLLASLKAKDLARRWLGPRAVRFFRLAYNLFAGVSFLPVSVLSALTPDHEIYLLPLPWSALMVAGQLLAVVALGVGFLRSDPWGFLGLRQLTALPPGQPAALMIKGLYHYAATRYIQPAWHSSG